jgi:hypothetical protein
MKPHTPDAVLRPGAEGWELWKFPLKESPSLDQAFSEKSLDTFANVVLALPSRSVLSMPLWIASQGDPAELAELELTSRHLLRKDAQVYTVPVLEKEGRTLVLALAATDDETPHGYLKKAKNFEIPARLFDPAGADVLVWHEQGGLCFAIYREEKCVFFAATGDANPGPAFCGAISRTAMRLKSEGVITRMPAKLRLIGDFSESDAASVGHTLRLDFEIEKHLLRNKHKNKMVDNARIRDCVFRGWCFRKLGLLFWFCTPHCRYTDKPKALEAKAKRLTKNFSLCKCSCFKFIFFWICFLCVSGRSRVSANVPTLGVSCELRNDLFSVKDNISCEMLT